MRAYALVILPKSNYYWFLLTRSIRSIKYDHIQVDKYHDFMNISPYGLSSAFSGRCI